MVVIIALVLIFKTQLTTLVNDIFERSQVKVRESNVEKGEITAFLSLIFVLMISFVTAILESASVQAEKNQARLDMDRAVYSVFGEYQKELLEEYGIFAVEGSYETGNFSEKQLIDRMHYYGASGIWPEVEGIQFLTDQNGQAFREGAVKYMEDLYGISIIQGLGASGRKVGNSRKLPGNRQRMRAIRVWKNWMIC